MTAYGVPWARPDADPLGDMQRIIALCSASPPPVPRHVACSQDTWDSLRGLSRSLAPAPAVRAFTQHHILGLSVFIDPDLPFGDVRVRPGWAPEAAP